MDIRDVLDALKKLGDKPKKRGEVALSHPPPAGSLAFFGKFRPSAACGSPFCSVAFERYFAGSVFFFAPPGHRSIFPTVQTREYPSMRQACDFRMKQLGRSELAFTTA
jgi:hypothetical protein